MTRAGAGRFAGRRRRGRAEGGGPAARRSPGRSSGGRFEVDDDLARHGLFERAWKWERSSSIASASSSSLT